jgi:hypothetical protein
VTRSCRTVSSTFTTPAIEPAQLDVVLRLALQARLRGAIPHLPYSKTRSARHHDDPPMPSQQRRRIDHVDGFSSRLAESAAGISPSDERLRRDPDRRRDAVHQSPRSRRVITHVVIRVRSFAG